MAIKIPPGEVLVTDKRLNAIKLISYLADRAIPDLRSKVKASMLAKHAQYAESEFAVAKLVTSSRTVIQAANLLKLYERASISRAQLLSALSVRKEPASEFLSASQIASISEVSAGEPLLYTDFKPGVEVREDEFLHVLEHALIELGH
jgi:hypothetical protein